MGIKNAELNRRFFVPRQCRQHRSHARREFEAMARTRGSKMDIALLASAANEK